MVTWICVGVMPVGVSAGVRPANDTVAPVRKPVPLMVSVKAVPLASEVGLRLVMTGNCSS